MQAILAGRLAPGAHVIVTSRPHTLTYLQVILGQTCILHKHALTHLLVMFVPPHIIACNLKLCPTWSHINLVLGKPLVHVTGETKSGARYPGCSKLNSWVGERLPILICSGPEWRGGLLVHPHFHREQDLAWQLGGALLLLLLLMFSEGVFAHY